MNTIFELAARIQAANTAEAMLLLLAKATLVLIIARLLLAAMPRASAATKHLLATATLVAVAAMPLVSVVVPAWELPVASSPLPAPARAEEAPQATGNRQPATIGVTDAEETVPVARSLAKAIVPTPLQRATALVASTWQGMLILAVAAVSLLMLGHMLAGMLGVWFVARGGREVEDDAALMELDAARDQLALGRDIRLLFSPRVSVPVVWGVFRPVLLLPVDAAQWPVERLRVVLLHELAHLKRVDGVSLIVTRVAVSLFWFHPLAWSLERAGRNECERACDDLVLAGGTKPSEYADHLLAIARTMPAFDPFRAVTLAMSRKSQLEGRLLSILQPGAARRVFGGRGVLAACAIAIGVIIPVSALRLIAQPSEVKPAETRAKAQPEASSTVDVTAEANAAPAAEPELETLESFLEHQIEHVSKKFGHHADSTYDRAMHLYKNERYAKAGDEFVRAHQEDPNPTALYNAACSYALAGDASRAAATLQDAIDAGWDDLDRIAEDSDFDPVRTHPQFKAVLTRYGSDLATRRLDDTIERYNELRAGRGRGGKDDNEWYDVGLDLLRLRRLDDSIQAFERSIDRGEKHGAAMYNIACAYALKGDVRNGLAWLDKAIENGYGDDDKLRQDPDIALLRQQSEFAPLVRKARDLELRDWDRFTRSWASAAEHHREMTARYPNSARAWFNYGYASLQARDFDNGVRAFRKTADMNYRPGTSAYNIACAYALQGNKDAAFEWLGRAEAAGFKLREHIHDDEDLDSLRRDPRWRALEARVY
ncbi:MAG TPA: M56 family metallopeptidase [Thermoanaerobaculia bacterium]|jgi:beta-lactamase regulating signal transducer with metallopeptidase domain